MLGAEIWRFGWPLFATNSFKCVLMFSRGSWRADVPGTRKPGFLIYGQSLQRWQLMATAVFLDNAKKPTS